MSTLYTAYRQNDPNELMPPHAHTASAVRFGLTGRQNFTGVEGEDITFLPGDMVLTPRDTWHNHGNRGGEPAINLSVLDYPLVENLNALSFQHDYQENGEVVRKQSARFQTEYSRMVYGAGGLTPRFLDHRRGGGDSSPMFVYRYEAMRELLYRFRDWDESPHEGVSIEYTHPLRGGPVYRTMTFFMQMVRPGETTLPLKQTANLLVSPFSGQGSMTVGEQRHALEPFDTVAVPSENWVQYRNDATEPLILFIASDEPALRAMGLFHQWGRTDWRRPGRAGLRSPALAKQWNTSLLAHVDCEGADRSGWRARRCMSRTCVRPTAPRSTTSKTRAARACWRRWKCPSAGIRTRCACATA
ncbi:cupin domain-containing protein [Achromobacter xylosoxidans]